MDTVHQKTFFFFLSLFLLVGSCSQFSDTLPSRLTNQKNTVQPASQDRTNTALNSKPAADAASKTIEAGSDTEVERTVERQRPEKSLPCPEGSQLVEIDNTASFYLAQCQRSDGIPHGPWQRSWNMQESNFRFQSTETGSNINGVAHGEYRRINSDIRTKAGLVINSGHFDNGKRDGVWVRWYNNGNVQEVFHFKKDSREGLMTRWHENGQMKERCNFTEDVRDGLYQRWYANGQLAEKGYYIRGVPEGEFTLFDEKGTPLGGLVQWSEGRVVNAEVATP